MDLATLTKVGSDLVFNTAGLYLVTHAAYKDYQGTLRIPSFDKEVGILCTYSPDSYHFKATVMTDGTFMIQHQENNQIQTYFEMDISEQTFPLSIKISKERYRFECFLNNVKIFEWNHLDSAYCYLGVFGEQNAVIHEFFIKEKQSSVWQTNASGNTRFKWVEGEEDMFCYLEGTLSSPAKMTQLVTLTAGNYVLSFKGIGAGSMRINGQTYPFSLTEFYVKANLQEITKYSHTGEEILSFYPEDTGHEALGELKEWVEETSLSFTIPTDAVYTLEFEATNPLLLSTPQIELNITSPFIPTTNEIKTRPASVLEFPIPTLTDRGSFYLDFSLPNQEGSAIIVKDNESSFLIRYDQYLEDSVLKTKIGFQIHNVVHEMMSSSNQHIKVYLSWSTQSVRFGVNESYETAVESLIFSSTNPSHRLIFSNPYLPTTLTEWAIWPEFYSNCPALESAHSHYTFSKGVGGKNATHVELPLMPMDYSPVLVEKETNEMMKKISFFDPVTGQYRTYHEDFIVYDGKSDFVLLTFHDVDQEGFYLQVLTEEGNIVGEPYRIEQKRLHMTLSQVEKDFYHGKKLAIRYQVKDSYTVDYNINALDGYRLNFSKQTGEHKKVYQEAIRRQKPMKLATMIEMNPLFNHHHDGFMYIIDEVHPTQTFVVTITSNHLVANGISQATILIEPRDYEGNPVVMSLLNVTCKHGHIYPDYSKQSLENQKRTGQYVYKYHVPYLSKAHSKEITKENIHIHDVEADIGVLKHLYLHSANKSYQDYQTIPSFDILRAKGNVAQAILRYEGLLSYQDPELHLLLDLNEDGLINMDDIVALEMGEKDREIINVYQILKDKGVAL